MSLDLNNNHAKNLEKETDNPLLKKLDDNGNYYNPMELPWNISLSDIEKLLPHFNDKDILLSQHNIKALINYIQTLHFSYTSKCSELDDLESRHREKTEQYEQLHKYIDKIEQDGDSHHSKLKDLEKNQKLLIDYSNRLRKEFATYLSAVFEQSYDMSKIASELIKKYGNEFTYTQQQQPKQSGPGPGQ